MGGRIPQGKRRSSNEAGAIEVVDMALRHRIALEEFLQEAETKPYREYFRGEVREKAVPGKFHSLTQVEVAWHLRSWAQAHGGRVVSEQRCILQTPRGPYVVLPDVAYFAPGTLSTDEDGPATVPPLVAVEILSPDDRYGEVQEKIIVYLSAGVPVVWALDPESRTVTAYRPGETPRVLAEPDTLEEPRLPGFCLVLHELFRQLDPAPKDEHGEP